MWHGYVGFQDLNLTRNQRRVLWNVFRDLPPAMLTGQPKHLNQFRVSLDNKKAICELLFNEGDITIANIKKKLATLFGVDEGNISTAQKSIEYGWSHSPVWTFAYNSTNYFRVVVFGGVGADWLQSKDAAKDYIRRNIEEWDEEDE